MYGTHALGYLKFPGQREMSVLGDCIVPSFLCSAQRYSPLTLLAGQHRTRTGLGTAVLQILTRREHTYAVYTCKTLFVGLPHTAHLFGL